MFESWFVDTEKKIINGVLVSGTTGPAPKIECWLPEGEASGIGLIIFPGGGYQGLADHEGAGYADFFSRRGIACFVVTYRLAPQGYRHPAMLEDALSAVYTVRSRASEFGVDPDRIGVMGSSAGGHLSAHTVTGWNEYESEVSLRPDFGVLCYPVITSSGPHVHAGSMLNLAGENPPPELLESLACEKRVNAETPPCFLWHTVEDAAVPVENSLLFAASLRKFDVPFELHVYPNGRHGLGLETTFPWGEECFRWITTQAVPAS